MDWRQFLCEELDRKIALIRLVMPENSSIVEKGKDINSDPSAYLIQERRDPVARMDVLVTEGKDALN
jgi:hypothetical protein